MTFLLPAAFTALALALPVIAFYLIKTRLRRKPVSTALFWQQLTPQVYNTSLWRKLRRWLSLALQLLFLALLVFAIAQPLASWQSLQPASVVVVLDPSASMNATDVAPTRWARASELAAQRIKTLRAFDEAALVLASDPPRVLRAWTSSKRALLDALAESTSSSGSSDIRPALALAKNLAQSRPHGRVLLLSDGCWKNPPPAEALAAVEFAPIIGDGANAGLTLFSARRSLAAPGEYQLAARIEARGKTALSGQLELYRDGKLTDAQAITVEPGKPWERTWDGQLAAGAKFEARLSGFPGDCLAADDRGETTLAAPQPIAVELIAPPNGFLDAALGSLNLVAWKRTWPAGQLAPAQPGTLYVFYRAAPPADFAASAVVFIDPSGAGVWGEPVGEIEQPLVSEWQRDSALLRHTGIERVQLRTAKNFKPPGGTDVLAESFGKPLIFGQWRGAQRWLALPFDLESSDLVLRTAFPILLGNVVESLRPEPPAATQPLPGTVETALASTAKLQTPNSKLQTPNGLSLWASHPLWWWAVALGLAWLLGEWWSYSRRITE